MQPPLGTQPQAGNAANYAGDAEELQRRRALMEQDNAGKERADNAQPRPDGIGYADRQVLQRQAQKPETGNHAENSQDTRQQAREAMRVMQPNRPEHFEETGNEQINPRHKHPPQNHNKKRVRYAIPSMA